MANGRALSDTIPEIPGYGEFVEIGSGGFSRVYKARQFEFNRPVAIKVLDSPLRDDDAVAAFERECRTMGAIWDHPNIVPVYASAFTTEGRPCIVMKLFHEGSYFQVLRRSGPIPIEELLLVGVKISGALAAAHEAGIIHGDVKPHNIFKSRFGEPALGDFGIATFVGQHSTNAPRGLSVHYAAPDLVEGEPGPNADQYSLAATIFTLAVGTRPFELPGDSSGDTNTQVLLRVLGAETPWLPDTFPQQLRNVIRRAMDRDPDLRYDNLNDLSTALAEVEQALKRPTTHQRPVSISPQERPVEARICLTCGTTHPPTASKCNGCGTALNVQTSHTETIPQPNLGTVSLSGGKVEVLDADLLVGRRPDTEALEPHQRAVTVGEGDRTISRCHIELRQNGWTLEAHIRGKNTQLKHLEDVSEVKPGAVANLAVGDTLYFGVDSSLEYTSGHGASAQKESATPSDGETNSDRQQPDVPNSPMLLRTIELSGGSKEILDADLIVGRNPTRQPLEPHQRAVTHGGDDRRISRRHVELRITEPHPTAICLGNLIVLERKGTNAELSSGDLIQLQPGDILNYGSNSWLRYEYGP